MSEPGKVLVADDDSAMRELLAAALAKYGHVVETTANGDATLTAAESGTFDVILLDRMMPCRGGMEVLRRLRKRFDSVELPIVMVTAANDPAAAVSALDAGANDYIAKPFDMAVVLARVRTHVTLRRQAAALSKAGEQLRREIAAAAALQRAGLPQAAPRFGPYCFAWHYEPCEQLSGDGLNVFAITPRYIGFYVLDAVGHGIRAALLAAAAGRLLLPTADAMGLVSEPKGVLERDVTSPFTPAVAAVRPAEVIARFARRFRADTAEGQYFTLLYALLDTSTGELRYASAGHPPPILLPRDHPPRRLAGGGLMIGVPTTDDLTYEEQILRLEPGDRLVLYSDGVTEARSAAGESLTEERLVTVLSNAPREPAAVAALAANACRSWAEGATGDDRTLLVVMREET